MFTCEIINKAIVFDHFCHLCLELVKLMRATHCDEIRKWNIFLARKLWVFRKFNQKLFDSKLSLLNWVGVFFFERNECLFRRKHRDEEAWIFTINSHSEKVKITITPLNLYQFFHVSWVSHLLWWARPVRFNLKYVITRVHHIFAVPSRSTHIYVEPHL